MFEIPEAILSDAIVQRYIVNASQTGCRARKFLGISRCRGIDQSRFSISPRRSSSRFPLEARRVRQFDRSNSLLPDNADCLVDQNPRTMRVSRQYIKRTSSSSYNAQASLPFLPLVRAKRTRTYAFDAGSLVKPLSRHTFDIEGQSESLSARSKGVLRRAELENWSEELVKNSWQVFSLKTLPAVRSTRIFLFFFLISS